MKPEEQTCNSLIYFLVKLQLKLLYFQFSINLCTMFCVQNNSQLNKYNDVGVHVDNLYLVVYFHIELDNYGIH